MGTVNSSSDSAKYSTLSLIELEMKYWEADEYTAAVKELKSV